MAVAAPAAAVPTGPSTEMVRKMYADREHEEITLDAMRKIIAARLTEAKSTIPHFYLRRGIELDALLKLRGQMNAKGEARGIKLSVNDFIIKASALALQQVPGCNAVWAGDRVLQFKASDVAVAVAIEGGLFTPVLRDAETKSLSVLSAEMKDLAARARERKLAPHEYQGGSFAISNLGMMGIENFDAVINPPPRLDPGGRRRGADAGGQGRRAGHCDGDVGDPVGRSPGDRRRFGSAVPRRIQDLSGRPAVDADVGGAVGWVKPTGAGGCLREEWWVGTHPTAARPSLTIKYVHSATSMLSST